jgi:WD40 repeat protein
VWSSITFKIIATLTGHQGCVTKIIKLNKHQIISCGGDQTVRIWDIVLMKEVQNLNEHKSYVISLALLTSDCFISGSFSSGIIVWKKNKLSNNFEQHGGHQSNKLAKIANILPLPCNSAIILGSWENINIFSLKQSPEKIELKFECTLSGHTNLVTDLKFIGTDNRYLMSASWDCTCRLWHLARRRCVRNFSGYYNYVTRMLAISNNVFISVSKEIKIWRVYSGECHTLQYKDGSSESAHIGCITKLTDGELVLVGVSKSLEVWKY